MRFYPQNLRSAAMAVCLVACLPLSATPDGGTVSSVSGETTIYTCPGDGVADQIFLSNTSSSSDPYQYIVTNSVGIVLALPPSNEVELDGAGVGTCLVYGLSYTGTLTIAAGDDINTATSFSTGMSELSANRVEAVREVPNAGTLQFIGGDTEAEVCAGDGVADELYFETLSASNSLYQYIITDDAGNILGLPPTGMVELDGAGPGTCLLWGVAYTGNFTAAAGDNVYTLTNFSDDCSDLSDNNLYAVRYDSAVCAAGACPVPTELAVTEVASDKVVVSWKEYPGVLGYRIQAKRNGEFVLNQNLNDNSMDYPTAPAKVYRWRVRSFCVDGISGWSDVNTYFSPALRTGISADNFTAYPNPASSQTRIEIGSPELDRELSIYDLRGRLVGNETVRAGENFADINVSEFESGLYQVVVLSAEDKMSLTLFVQ